MERSYYVYILASRSRDLYTGVTNNLPRRLLQHRESTVPAFTSRYRIFRLVHYEVFHNVRAAIAREKEIKGWRREKKIRLIERDNPTWNDLAARWFPNIPALPPMNPNQKGTKSGKKADPLSANTRPPSG